MIVGVIGLVAAVIKTIVKIRRQKMSGQSSSATEFESTTLAEYETETMTHYVGLQFKKELTTQL